VYTLLTKAGEAAAKKVNKLSAAHLIQWFIGQDIFNESNEKKSRSFH